MHQLLEKIFNSDSVSRVCIINSDDVTKARADLEKFLTNYLGHSFIENSNDYLCISSEDEVGKSILVSQIRKLKDFVHTTSLVGGKKIALILGAEAMNINASNACLKILEEPPLNCHIFLITNNINMLTATIRSRCSKIEHYYHRGVLDIQEQEKFLLPLLNSTKISDRLEFFNIFNARDKVIWQEFSSYYQYLMSRCIKISVNLQDDSHFSEKEKEFLLQIKQKAAGSFYKLESCYDKMMQLIDETSKLDLDHKMSAILLVHLLKDLTPTS